MCYVDITIRENDTIKARLCVGTGGGGTGIFVLFLVGTGQPGRHVDGVVVREDDHARFGAVGLLDVPDFGVVHGHVVAVPAVAVNAGFLVLFLVYSVVSQNIIEYKKDVFRMSETRLFVSF